MSGITSFTRNYTDLSDENGYQFEFRCDICGSGYRSTFVRSQLGTAGNLLRGASSLLGGQLWGASNAADTVRDVTDRGARDQAMQQAMNEVMPLFKRCPRCSRWVDETCWNEEAGLCVGDAPKLAGEMAATRSEYERQQMREAMSQERHFSGDTAAKQTVCSNCGKPVGSEKFCSNCGTPVGMRHCTQCGDELATGARFCGNCGAASA